MPRASRLQILFRVVMLAVAAIAFYFLLPQLLDVWEQIPKLTAIKWWFVVILPLEAGSFACQWKLTRTALPQVSWFVAATAQLASNAIAKVVPGGAAVGGATGYRMLSVSGVNRATAGAALAATAIVSNGVLFALPMVAVLGSILTAPVPGDLAVIAWGGALLFLVLFAIVFTLVRFDRPLWAVGGLIERVSGWLIRHVLGPIRSWSSRMPVHRAARRRPRRADAGRHRRRRALGHRRSYLPCPDPRPRASCASATSWSPPSGPAGGPPWWRRWATGGSTTWRWWPPSTR